MLSLDPREVGTTIITYEEQSRGWLSIISRAKSAGEQIQAYGRLENHLDYLFRKECPRQNSAIQRVCAAGKPTMPERLCRLLVLLLILRQGLSPTSAAEQAGSADKIELKLNYSPNETWKVSQQAAMAITTAVTSQSQRKTIHETRSISASVVRTTLEAKNGKPTKVRLAFDDKCELDTTVDGKDQNTPFPLSGKTVTMTIKPDGGVDLEPADVLGSGGAALMEYAISGQRAFFPDHPVGPNDSWTVKPEVLAKMAQLQVNAKLTGGVTCTLNRIVMREGRKVAEITQKGYVAGTTNNGGELTLSYEGPWFVDVATGETVLLESRGDMTTKTSDADIAAENPRISGSGTSRMSYHAEPVMPTTAPAH